MSVLQFGKEKYSSDRLMAFSKLFSGSNWLLEYAQRGDRAAFDQLLDPYRPALRRYLQRHVGSQDAEDAFQEVILAAWCGLPRFVPRASFKTWLFAIAEYKSMTWHSRNRWRGNSELQEEAHEVAFSDPAFHQSDLRDLLENALKALPPEQAQIVVLYFEQGMTLQEISFQLNRNLNTVKTQFYAGRKKLASVLEEQEAKAI